MARETISLEWLKGLSDEDKESLKRTLLSDTTILPKLLEILRSKESGLQSQENSISDFSDSSWAYKQAFRNGQRSVYAFIKQLTTFKTED